MSLIPSVNNKKSKKTADLLAYQKEYRVNNLNHLRNLDRSNYYKKKYNLDKEFIGLFGEYSGDVFKIIKAFNELTENCPELAPHIVAQLNEHPKKIE